MAVDTVAEAVVGGESRHLPNFFGPNQLRARSLGYAVRLRGELIFRRGARRAAATHTGS